MAELDFSHFCGVSGNDEFGELPRSLNVMAQNLQKAFEELEHVNQKLEQDVEQKSVCSLSAENWQTAFHTK